MALYLAWLIFVVAFCSNAIAVLSYEYSKLTIAPILFNNYLYNHNKSYKHGKHPHYETNENFNHSNRWNGKGDAAYGKNELTLGTPELYYDNYTKRRLPGRSNCNKVVRLRKPETNQPTQRVPNKSHRMSYTLTRTTF